MKKYVIFLICLVVSSMIFSQNKMPRFVGSTELATSLTTENSDLISAYLKENIICPARAAECCKEGTEVVEFTVTPDGNVTNFKELNSVCPELYMEVIRVLNTTNGKWIPATRNGKPVAMTKEVAFMFGDHDRNTITNYFVKAASRHFKNGSKYLVVKNNPRKALCHFNMGINYMPNDKALLALRGLCHYELGEIVNAQKDWNRIVALGGINSGLNMNNLAELKGFQEMKQILAQK